MTLFEELVLLKEYEKSEDVLAEKVTSKQQEKLDMQSKVGKVSVLPTHLFLISQELFPIKCCKLLNTRIL